MSEGVLVEYSTVIKLKEFRAKLSLIRRDIERYLSHDTHHCEDCCFASKTLKPNRLENRYDTMIAGSSNYLVCMCGCDDRGSLPTIVRPWQRICKSFVSWPTYHQYHDLNDRSWTPESLKNRA